MSQKKTQEVPIRVRLATEVDVPFIFNSWLKSFRAEHFAVNITNTIYFNEHHKLIEDLLQTCEVYIACDHNNPEDIFGYICAERIDGILIIHYVYVKHMYRRLGIGKTLLGQFNPDLSVASIYSHSTKVVADRIAHKYNLVYSPYVAFLKQYRQREKKDESK